VTPGWASAKRLSRLKPPSLVKYSAGHPNWFQPDGLHLTVPGLLAFTRLIVTALPYAYPGETHHKASAAGAFDWARSALWARLAAW
jgi:hypothetical protein